MRRCSSSFDIAANYLTRGFGEGVKGPTINAIASSLPELLISSLFLFYFKDVVAESHGARGYFMQFTLENTNTRAVELFAVGGSIMKSFP